MTMSKLPAQNVSVRWVTKQDGGVLSIATYERGARKMSASLPYKMSTTEFHMFLNKGIKGRL